MEEALETPHRRAHTKGDDPSACPGRARLYGAGGLKSTRQMSNILHKSSEKGFAYLASREAQLDELMADLFNHHSIVGEVQFSFALFDYT
ncbi:MAG: hypothetical protein ABJI75_08765 [Nitratireductor sp.]